MAGESDFFTVRFGQAQGTSLGWNSLHTRRATSAVFDDPNLVSAAGLVPVLALAESGGLRDLADEHLSVPTDKGANAGLKVTSLVGGMVAGADSIDDMALLRHGGMGRVLARAYAPSTLGSFLRAFTFGHVRQLDAIASRFLIALAGLTHLVGASARDDATATEQTTASGYGVLVTVLSAAPIRRVLRPCSGGTRFAGALDSAIDRRSADGEQFG